MAFSDNGGVSPKLYVANYDSFCKAKNCNTNDCDCACAEQVDIKSLSSAIYPNVDDTFLHMPLVLSDKLVTISVNDYTSVFNMIYGDLLVLDSIGSTLLQRFGRPTRISDIVTEYPEISSNAIKFFCSILNDFKILRQVNTQEPKTQITPRSDTLTVWLHLNNQCNLQCQYCYVKKSPQKMSESVTKSTIEKIVTLAVSGGYERIRLKYAGGEPTLTPDLLIRTHLLAETLAETHQLELEGKILSNGVRLPAPLIDFSLHHGLKWAISLDGLNNGHDAQRPLLNGAPSSQKVLASIEVLRKYGISPAVSITVTQCNLAGLPALVEYMLRKRLRFNLNFYRQNGNSEDMMYPNTDDLINALKETYTVVETNLPERSLLSSLLDRVDFRAPHLYPCAAGWNYLAIGYLGNAAPCQMLVSQPDEVPMNAISVCDQLQSEAFRNLSITTKMSCKKCPWRYFCAGGCPMEAFHAYGHFDAPSPYCEVYRALAPAVLRLETLRVLKHQQPINFNGVDREKQATN